MEDGEKMIDREEVIKSVVKIVEPYLGEGWERKGRELADVLECVGKLVLPHCHVKVELTQIRIN